MRPSASFSSLAWRPLSSVNTFRSTLPGRYGHGDGLVTKNLGKRKGALNPGCLAQLVTKSFMRLTNAEGKSWEPSISLEGVNCPPEGQALAVTTERNQSRDARSTLNPAASSRVTTSSIDCGSRASHSTSINVSLAGRLEKMRLWLISSTLTPAS